MILKIPGSNTLLESALERAQGNILTGFLINQARSGKYIGSLWPLWPLLNLLLSDISNRSLCPFRQPQHFWNAPNCCHQPEVACEMRPHFPKLVLHIPKCEDLIPPFISSLAPHEVIDPGLEGTKRRSLAAKGFSAQFRAQRYEATRWSKAEPD